MSQQAVLDPNVIKLCKALKSKKNLPLSELEKEAGKEACDPSHLADALGLDLIEIGRQNYSRNIQRDSSKVVKEKDGKTPKRDENGRMVMEHIWQTNMDNDWSWMTEKNSAGRMTIQDLLDEAELDESLPPIHVRLTNAGIAAAAGRAPNLSAV